VYPPACFSNSSDFLKQNVLSESNTAINSVWTEGILYIIKWVDEPFISALQGI
jgi:hypothetical protein